jgi:hypothetical protein
MKKRQKLMALISLLALFVSAASAQEATKPGRNKSLAPSAGSNPVVGSGTTGQIPKWLGSDGASTFTIGNSNIFEDKFGKVAIGGLPSGTSLLTVRGMIETTLGGYKFPDGTIQTTAFNPSQVVRSLNGLTGNVTLAAGANITITPSGNTLTIAAANALTGVAHDTTLQGNGTLASPLGVAVPLILSGSGANGNATITATNTSGVGAVGIRGVGGSGMGIHFGVPTGVIGESNTGVGVLGNSNDFNGVIGRSNSMDSMNAGVEGSCANCNGVRGEGLAGVSGKGSDRVGSFVGVGVDGRGGDSSVGIAGNGVFAEGGDSNNGEGGEGIFTRGGEGNGAGNKSGTGIRAVSGIVVNGATAGPAGRFLGDVQITGNMSATGTKMFKIDHPIDPENKYLNHAAIESSEVLNIYSGNITTDQNGDATIALPDWFEALNTDFRYQLTVIGTFAQAIVASKMKGNRFVIKTTAPNTEVSWQVTGVRSDAGMKKYPFKVEETKTERERGHYLTPEVFNQPEEKSIEWALHPEMMQKLKQRRLETEKAPGKQN